ncbi:hypothetical protein FRX31_024514 [Thalictrum thalictroides]|uniref:Pentatricopeptide repeat-containing protein n=1 Tax=Thalictrum thalictroides TaxID=46969 RepID=A0A7J6VMP6_THATH|nr:hypothetical protein FRX31_024514 [Thalictrum thalictroides]
MGEDEEASKLFKQALMENLKVDDFTWLGTIVLLKEIYMVSDGLQVRNLGAWNSMLVACAQHGHVHVATNRD